MSFFILTAPSLFLPFFFLFTRKWLTSFLMCHRGKCVKRKTRHALVRFQSSTRHSWVQNHTRTRLLWTVSLTMGGELKGAKKRALMQRGKPSSHKLAEACSHESFLCNYQNSVSIF